jgi:hypothetical protein
VSVHDLVQECRANNNVKVANEFFEKCGKAQIFGNGKQMRIAFL